MPVITVCMLDRPAGACLKDLSAAIAAAFGAEVRPVLMVLDISPAFDADRGQFEAGALLKLLESRIPPSEAKVVAITSEDLFTPILSFAFGEAERAGRLAVVSLHRLRTGFYGLPESSDVLLERLRKETIHELGHTFGLTHCPVRHCPMHPSNSAEDLDLRGTTLCQDCRRGIVVRHVKKYK